MLMRTAQLSDLAYMSSNPDLMKALTEKKKREEDEI